MKSSDWRDELTSFFRYKKRFALFPVTCSDGTEVWLKNYYKKYELWNSDYSPGEECNHRDFIENISEAEYVVRKLADNL
jgi:hypothetical protein